MIRHIELTIDFDLTCWAESMEDFENDSIEFINEEVADYIINNSDELLDHLTIKKIWYENDEEQKGENKMDLEDILEVLLEDCEVDDVLVELYDDFFIIEA